MTLTWTPGPLLSWTRRMRLRIFRLARFGLPPLSFGGGSRRGALSFLGGNSRWRIPICLARLF
ncbi:hypothetical protein OIU84_029918 [Salix udensis]|uniref:Uncharacterized protein n=1 Tax=Salix udensis TaxID=889485 RepID=A0AAD6P898_9ROSI|nr:hypothetical protein OIU84_029918 [Salix udensis]